MICSSVTHAVQHRSSAQYLEKRRPDRGVRVSIESEPIEGVAVEGRGRCAVWGGDVIEIAPASKVLSPTRPVVVVPGGTYIGESARVEEM